MTIISYTPDPNNRPKLTLEQEKKLDALTDETIDYSDIPELDEAFWETATIIKKDTTEPVTLRVKQSVLEYFKGDNKKGYQSRMNRVLETYVQSQT